MGPPIAPAMLVEQGLTRQLVIPAFAMYVSAVMVMGPSLWPRLSRLEGAIVVMAFAAFVIPYLLGSAWAVAKHWRALWPWPLAVILTYACGLVVLAVAEGGTHYCYT